MKIKRSKLHEVKKLHLGCGDIILAGYLNCDLYNPKAEFKCDVKELPFENDSIEEIYASHLIEHFDFKEAFVVLKEWYRVLKQGGKLIVETPDFLNLCKLFINSDERGRVNLYGQFFAKAWLPGEVHKFLYTETQLGWTLKQCGFRDVVREENKKWVDLPAEINLRMAGVK